MFRRQLMIRRQLTTLLATAMLLATLVAVADARTVSTRYFSFHLPAGWHNRLKDYSVPYGLEFYASPSHGGIGFEVQKVSGLLSGHLGRRTVLALIKSENAAASQSLAATYRGTSTYGGASSFFATVVFLSSHEKEVQEFLGRGANVFVLDFAGRTLTDARYARALFGSSWRWK